MAFPFEPSHLRAQQRAFCLATCESDFDSTKRVIKPLTSGIFYEACNDKYFAGYRPSSPPIPVELPESESRAPLDAPLSYHKRHSSRAAVKVSHTRRKSRISALTKVKEPLAESIRKRNSFEFQDSSLEPTTTAESLVEIKERRKSSIMMNPLSKLFVKSEKSKTLRSDSQSTLSQSSLSAPAESFDSASGSVPAVDEFDPYSDSNSFSDDSFSNESLTDEDNFVSDEVETLEQMSHDDAESFEKSVDSAFTDIEADSIIGNSPNILYDYTVPKPPILPTNSRARTKQGLEFGSSVYGKKLGGLNDLSETTKGCLDPENSEANKTMPLVRRRESFSFSKVPESDLQDKKSMSSNLSSIIQTRHVSSNANPLTFFSFSGENIAEGVRKADISIFVPPETTPILAKLSVTGNMTVFHCIGYILLEISKLENGNKTKELAASFNPNHYRLELTDEDGELYDSNFGVLDRTRLLSSYNCPKHLALCKISSQAQISQNEKQSPLPLEFKQNLDLFEEKSRKVQIQSSEDLTGWNLAPPGGNSIEVKVKNIPSTSKVISFFVASKMQVGELLDLICRQYQVDSTQYRLSGFQASPHESINDKLLLDEKGPEIRGRIIPLQNAQHLSEIHVSFFQLEQIKKNIIRSMLDVKDKRRSFQEASITPNSSAYLQSGITPPVVPLGADSRESTQKALDQYRMGDTHEPQTPMKSGGQNLTRHSKLSFASNIGHLTGGAAATLPSSLNTFYCKWKVFRKKAPLIYRIEKSLIIDGEYVHLAPTDDTNWKSNYNDHSVSGASQSGTHSHHHYLHHYNYSKFYNDTMLKTSSFHISQIIKLKSYKEGKSPTHFKIVVKKPGDAGGKETMIKKKYDLEAETMTQCDEIFEKIRWALQLYNASTAG